MSNVSCGLSNLSIKMGDKVGFLILGKNEAGINPSPESSYGISNFNTTLYKPFLPPVFGELSTYNEVINIEDSVTSSTLEHMFQRPVTDVLRCITFPIDVYCHRSPFYDIYFSANRDWRIYGTPYKASLEALGFRSHDFSADIECYTFDGYTIIVELPNKDQGDFRLKSTWTITESQTGLHLMEPFAASDVVTVMNRFSQATGLYPGFERADYERIALLNSLSGMFFLTEVYEPMRDYRNKVAPSERKEFFYSHWRELMMSMENGADNENLMRDTISPYLWDTCLPMDIDLLSRFKDPAELYPIHEFIEVAGMLNKVIAPSVWGTVFGTDEASQELNDATYIILAKREAERKEHLADIERRQASLGSINLLDYEKHD